MGKMENTINTGLKLPKAASGGRLLEFRAGWASAFTRLDLVCVIFMTGILLCVAGLNLTGERGRKLYCAYNLTKLGHAMQDYAGDHGGGLPPASSVQPPATWDMLLTPYLRPDLVSSNSAYAKRLLKRTVAPRFVCPSDNLVRVHTRSYVMSGHDMQPKNWPPNPANTTGVGLVWDEPRMRTLLEVGAWNQVKTNGSLLALVKPSWLPAPADTLLLTELVRTDNQLENPLTATVGSARQQVEEFTSNWSLLHRGRINYLMADGHVEWRSPLEWLSPNQTGNAGSDQSSGIWTIKAGD